MAFNPARLRRPFFQHYPDATESFRSRPLDPAGYPYLWVDALTQRVREEGRIVNVCAVNDTEDVPAITAAA